MAAIGLDPASAAQYSPSNARHLRHLLGRLKIDSTDRILDYGCGKGRALRTRLDYPFASADGVELSPTLGAIARRNFARLGVPEEGCRIISSDAAVFTDLDRYTHFYLYNPFPSVVVREVVTNMLASLDRHRRSITIVYYNATCLDDFVGSGRFRIVHETSDEEQNRSVILVSDS